MKLVEAYKLERRIAMLERSVGRGGAPSIAMNMWRFLSDNGPSTVDDIAAGLGPRYSNKPTLQSYLDAGLITKNGDRYAANPDYEWEDVGKISSPYRLNIADAQLPIDNSETTNVDNTPKTRRARAPKTVTPNIWSFKPEEVKAAIDAGVNVNSKDDKGRTPLFVATMSKRAEALQIVKLLLDNGANPDSKIDGLPIIALTVKRDKLDTAILMASSKDYKPIFDAIQSVLDNSGKVTDKPKFKNLMMALFGAVDDSEFDTTYKCSIISRLIRMYRYDEQLFNYLYDRFESHIKSGTDSIAEEFHNNAKYEVLELGTFRIVSSMITNHTWLASRIFVPRQLDLFEIDKQSATKFFNLLKSNYDNTLKNTNYKDVLRDDTISLGRYLNQDLNFVNTLVSAESVNAMSKEDAQKLFLESIKSKDLGTVKIIAESKRADLYDYSAISELCKLDDSNRQLIMVAIKIINRSLKTRGASANASDLSSWVIDDMFKSNNRYVIEWLLDEDEATVVRTLHRRYNNTSEFNSATSEIVRKVFTEHGITFGAEANRMTRRPPKADKTDKRIALRELGKLLKNDGSNIGILHWADNYGDDIPDLWEDPDVIDVVYDPQYDDSVLATQLRREVSKSKSEPAKYDF